MVIEVTQPSDNAAVVWFEPWDELARAEMTLRLGHGQRRLATRVLLADGRVLEQINPGLLDLENDWHEVDRFSDLDAEVARLARDGWSVRGKDGVAGRPLAP